MFINRKDYYVCHSADCAKIDNHTMRQLSGHLSMCMQKSHGSELFTFQDGENNIKLTLEGELCL